MPRADRVGFMAGHLPGSLYAPLNKTFPTIAGSYIEPEQGIVLVIEPEQLETAVRQLIRIGLDDIRGYVTPAEVAASEGLAAIQRVTFAQAESLPGAMLDVRKLSEYRLDHFDGAVNVAHTRLIPRLDDVPEGTVQVHCASGARAASAASFLARTGRDVIYVDDHFANYRARQAETAEVAG